MDGHLTTIQLVGIGNVGSQIAFGILCKFHDVRILLTDKNMALLEAQYFDMASANMMTGGNVLEMTDSIAHADVYIVSAGWAQKNGKSRDSLYADNLPICRDVFERIADINPSAWVLVVTNPSHRIAQEGLRHLQKVIPTGKMLDATRAMMALPKGTHESPWSRDIFQFIKATKGYTPFGPAGEVLKMLEEII